MKTCNCYGSNAIRRSLGVWRCDCGGAINEWTVQSRFLERLEVLERSITDLTGALRSLGATECHCCHQWKVGNLMFRSASWCADCLKANPWITIDEEDDEESADETAIRVVRYLTGKGITGMKLDGLFLDAYRKIAR